MVHAAAAASTTMTLVMAEKDQPVYRDFLGLDRGVVLTSKQQQQPEATNTLYSTTTASDHPHAVLLRRSRIVSSSSGAAAGGFDSEAAALGDHDLETGFVTATTTTRGGASTSGTGTTSGRFETSSAPGYVSPSSFGLALPASCSSDPGSVGWQVCSTSSLQHHGIRSAFCKPDFVDGSSKAAWKKRDYAAAAVIHDHCGSRESLQAECLEAMQENSSVVPPQKMARIEQHKSRKYAEVLPPSIVDDLRLSMQPPPQQSSGNPPLWLQQASSKQPSDVLNRVAMHEGSSQTRQQQLVVHGTNSGQLQVPSRMTHLGACAEREAERTRETAAVSIREHTGILSPPIITRPAADEGSRTGLKGSPLVGLISNSSAGGNAPVPAGSSGPPPPLLPRKPMNSTASGSGSDSRLPTIRQGLPPTSRQLTIFYGGQAHVFDNVPSDKAEFILALAGSHGKSWSTTSSPRPAASVPDSASEGSLSALEKEKTVQSHGGSVSGRRSLPLSTDGQTLLRGYANAGNVTGCPS